LVPALAAWAAWRRLRGRPLPPRGWPLLGSLEMAAGFVVHLAATVLAWLPLQFLSLVLVLRGAALVARGRRFARRLTFPILFLFFMFPLPFAWTKAAGLWLQDVVGTASALVLNLFTVCYLRGNTLYLTAAARPLVIADECSGLRQIEAFVA